MEKRRLLSAFVCVLAMMFLAISAVQAQGPVLIDTLGGVEVWTIPEASPADGLQAATIMLKGVDEASKLVTFENIALSGPLVQAWLPGSFGGPPQPTTYVGIAPAWNVIPESWQLADSHINISADMVGGGAGGSHGGLGEINDLSNPDDLAAKLPELGPGASAVTGVGGIAMAAPTDAFFLDTPFQSREVSLAYVVAENSAQDFSIGLTIGVLGEGIVNSGDPGGAQWGFEDQAPLGVFPFPVVVDCIAPGVECFELLRPTNPISGGQSDGTNFNVGVAGTAAGVNNWPAGESPDHAIDGVGQKYLNFGETETGFVVTPGPSTVGGIKVWAANDAEERDPTRFEIFGTNGDVSGNSIALADLTPIATGALNLPSSRNAGGGAALDDANAFTAVFTNDLGEFSSYLVLFPDVKDAASANSMQVAEVQLLGVPEPGSMTLLGLGGLLLGLLRRRRK